MKFTDRSIQSIKPREERFEIWETGRKGFGLRVYPSGKKSWVFLYRYNGKSRRMTFGEYPAMSLSEAHQQHAAACCLLKENNVDPGAVEQAAKDEARRAPTITDLVDEFIDGIKNKGNRSWSEYDRNLKKDVVPAWGGRKVKDISRRDVILLLEDVFRRGAPNQSTQVLKIVRRMFNFAIERGILEANPAALVKPLAPEVKKDRFLSDNEVGIFWLALDSCPMSDILKRALRLILVTAQRPGEVIGLRASEVDGHWWTIPADRSKNKRAHRVYLTKLALDLLPEPGAGGLYFPSPRLPKPGEDGNVDTKPIEVNALAHALRRALAPSRPQTGTAEPAPPALPLEHFTPHDLRRTAASHMASLGYGIIVEKVLNHTNRTVTAIYDRYSYDNEKRQALEAWARKLDRIINNKQPDNLVEFSRA
ncbi:MAG: tyrosine-type recombinase/integrase [Desulfuromonadales bacterium]